MRFWYSPLRPPSTDATRLVALGRSPTSARQWPTLTTRPAQERTVTAALLDRTAHALVVRLAKGKLGQVVPIIGSAVAAVSTRISGRGVPNRESAVCGTLADAPPRYRRCG